MHTQVKSRVKLVVITAMVASAGFASLCPLDDVSRGFAASCAASAAAPAAADVPAAVTLSGQRVQLTPETNELTVNVTVHNDLDVALEAVDVGWLLAGQAQQLENVRDPGPLYLDADDPKRAPLPPGVMVLRRAVALTVPAHGSAVASFSAASTAIDSAPDARSPSPSGQSAATLAWAPSVYRTHVLAYTLADASLPLLLRLLHGSAAADEKAAVDYFGLAGDAEARLAARRHLSAISAWVDALVPRATPPVAQHPTESEAHERIYAVRALGVVGGSRAETALAQLRDRSDIALLDDFVRVLLIDRLRGTRLETPLAFAVPPSARTMRDIVDAALADARDLSGEVAKAHRDTTLAAVSGGDGASGAAPGASVAASPGVSTSPTTSTTPERSPTPAINDAAPAPAPQPVVTPVATGEADHAATAPTLLRRLLPWAVCLLAFIITLRLLRGRRK